MNRVVKMRHGMVVRPWWLILRDGLRRVLAAAAADTPAGEAYAEMTARGHNGRSTYY
jgi:hypothetical protein